MKILFKPIGLNRLYTSGDKVYVHDDRGPRPAKAFEVESIVASNIDARFGDRFSDTLKDVSRDSLLLAKMPAAIPLFLKCRPALAFLTAKQLSALRILPASSKGREVAVELEELQEKLVDEFPFGMTKGNCTVLPTGLVAPRDEEHYIRFSLYRGEVAPDVINRLNSKMLSEPTLLVLSGGAVGLADAPVLTNSAAYVLAPPEGWKGFTLGLLAWFKSSFFLWYCAVHLADPDLYSLLYDPETRLPVPRPDNADLYKRLGAMASNILIEEHNFLDEVYRAKKKGMDSAGREKLRRRHNKTANAMCLSIDEEIAAFLKLSDEDQGLIAETLRDVKLTDFGYAEKKDVDARDAGE